MVCCSEDFHIGLVGGPASSAARFSWWPWLADVIMWSSHCEEANDARECLVPKIAGLYLPSEAPEIMNEMSAMFAALSGKEPWMCLVLVLIIFPNFRQTVAWIPFCNSFAKDKEASDRWATMKVEASQTISQGQVSMTLIHQWRWDSASLWLAGCKWYLYVATLQHIWSHRYLCFSLFINFTFVLCGNPWPEVWPLGRESQHCWHLQQHFGHRIPCWRVHHQQGCPCRIQQTEIWKWNEERPRSEACVPRHRWIFGCLSPVIMTELNVIMFASSEVGFASQSHWGAGLGWEWRCFEDLHEFVLDPHTFWGTARR